MKLRHKNNRFAPNLRNLCFNTDPAGGGGGGGAAPVVAAAPVAAAPVAAAPVVAPAVSPSSVEAVTTLPTGPQPVVSPPDDGKWKESLGELAKAPTIANVKTLNDLAQMAINGETTIGQLRTQLKGTAPAADAKPEEAGKYFQSKYAPEKPEGYGFDKRPEGLPEAIPYDPANGGEFAKLAHEFGLHPAQAKAMQGWAVKMALADQAKKAEAVTKLTNDYKTLWGPDFDKKLDLNGRVLTQHLNPAQLEQMKALPADARLLLAAAVDNIREKFISEDTITPPNAETPGGTQGKSLAQLQQDMHKLQQEPAYFNPQVDKARHEELKKQVSAISGQIAQMKGGTK